MQSSIPQFLWLRGHCGYLGALFNGAIAPVSSWCFRRRPVEPAPSTSAKTPDWFPSKLCKDCNTGVSLTMVVHGKDYGNAASKYSTWLVELDQQPLLYSFTSLFLHLVFWDERGRVTTNVLAFTGCSGMPTSHYSLNILKEMRVTLLCRWKTGAKRAVVKITEVVTVADSCVSFSNTDTQCCRSGKS